jgi:hypothetical protein
MQISYAGKKFNNLFLIDSGRFIQPEQKSPTLLQQRNGVYDGLEVFMLDEEAKLLKRETNNRALSIKVQIPSRKQCYGIKKWRNYFEHTGSPKEIALPYELLIVAYRAVCNPTGF